MKANRITQEAAAAVLNKFAALYQKNKKMVQINVNLDAVFNGRKSIDVQELLQHIKT